MREREEKKAITWLSYSNKQIATLIMSVQLLLSVVFSSPFMGWIQETTSFWNIFPKINKTHYHHLIDSWIHYCKIIIVICHDYLGKFSIFFFIFITTLCYKKQIFIIGTPLCFKYREIDSWPSSLSADKYRPDDAQ